MFSEQKKRYKKDQHPEGECKCPFYKLMAQNVKEQP